MAEDGALMYLGRETARCQGLRGPARLEALSLQALHCARLTLRIQHVMVIAGSDRGDFADCSFDPSR